MPSCGAVLVEPYNDSWPLRFAEVAAHVSARVPAIVIEHVGSTSIQGMTAKPVIDVDVVVPDGLMPAAIEALTAAGYAHQGDLGIPGREAFRAASEATQALPAQYLTTRYGQ